MNDTDIPVPLYTDPGTVATGTPWWSVSADLFLKLGFVLLLIYVSLWLLRRFLQPGAGRPGHMLVNIVEQTTLAPGRSVYLLEVGTRLLLVGSTANQLTTLTEITDPAEVAEIQGLRQSEVASGPAFGAQLRALLERTGARRAQPVTPDDQSEPSLRDRIQELRSISTRPGER